MSSGTLFCSSVYTIHITGNIFSSNPIMYIVIISEQVLLFTGQRSSTVLGLSILVLISGSRIKPIDYMYRSIILDTSCSRSNLVQDEFTKKLLFSETHRKPMCLVGDPSKTDMLHQRPRHASSETHLRLTCPI